MPTVKLTENYSIAPEIKDPHGFALYDSSGAAHGWSDGDVAVFSDDDNYSVGIDREKRSITLINNSRNIVRTFNY